MRFAVLALLTALAMISSARGDDDIRDRDYHATPAEVAAYLGNPEATKEILYRGRAEKTGIPYEACKNKTFYVYQGTEKFLTFPSKNPNGNAHDRFSHGKPFKTIAQGVIESQVPPCGHDRSWVPNANINAGFFLHDFYEQVQDYEDARSLALAAGEEKLQYFEEQKLLRTKVTACIGKLRTWPPHSDKIEGKLSPESSCDEIAQYFVKEYLVKYRAFRQNLALASDIAPGIGFDEKNIGRHFNSTLTLPKFWPESKLQPLSQDEQADLRDTLIKWRNEIRSEDLLPKAYAAEVALQQQKVIERGSLYPSFFSLSSPNPAPKEVLQMLDNRSTGLSEDEINTRASMARLEKFGSTEKMDDIFSLTLNPTFVSRALKKHPELCAAEGGILLRKAVSQKRMLGYTGLFALANLFLGRVVPKPVMAALSSGFLGLDVLNLYLMRQGQLAMNKDFSTTLTQTEVSIGVQQLVDANKLFLRNEGMLVGFAIPSAFQVSALYKASRATRALATP